LSRSLRHRRRPFSNPGQERGEQEDGEDEQVTWAEPGGLIHYTRELSAGAGGFVRFFMVAALPWPAVIAITAATVGLRSPSVRLVAFLLPLFAGAAFAGAAGDNTGRRLRNVGDPRDVAALHDSTTVAAVVFGFLALASIALLFRLHVVYSAMLALLYTAVAGYYVAGAAAPDRHRVRGRRRRGRARAVQHLHPVPG
jgi:hypothetical protein